MSPETNNQDNFQFYKVTADQAEQLKTLEVGPEADELVRSIGAVAGEGALGVVVKTLEDGSEVPDHLVILSGEDQGTKIVPEKQDPAKGLPSAEEAYALINQDQQEVAEQGSESDIDAAQKIERAVEQSNMVEILARYSQLSESIANGQSVERNVIEQAQTELNQLIGVLQMAADSGPWGTVKLAMYPNIIHQMRTMSATFATESMRAQSGSDEASTELNSFNDRFGESADTVKTSLHEVEDDDAQILRRSVEEVRDAIQNVSPRLKASNADNWATLARTLEDSTYDHLTTVDDVRDTLMRFHSHFEDMMQDNRTATNVGNELALMVGDLARKIQA